MNMTWIYVCYLLILNKPFGSISRGILYKVMLRMGILVKIIKLLQRTVGSTRAKIKVGDKRSEPIQFSAGVKQGEALPTTIFNIAPPWGHK
jgi:hypothetical protein